MAYNTSVRKSTYNPANYQDSATTMKKPFNLKDISSYVDKALTMSANPIGRQTIKMLATQYAGSTGIEPKVFANAVLHFLDEIRENSPKNPQLGFTSMLLDFFGK